MINFNMKTANGEHTPVIFKTGKLRIDAHQQPEDILQGLIRQGEQVLIYSSTGSYKSWLGTSIWLAVANGSSVAKTTDGFDKWKAPKSRKVLLLDGELDQYDLGERLNKLCPNYGDNEGLVLMRQMQSINSAFPNLAKSDDQDSLINFCVEQEIELLVLDNLTTLADVVDENAASAMKPLTHLLQKLKAAGVATVLIHHSNKGDNSYRGSTVLATTFNAIIKLKRDSVERGLFSLIFEKARNSHIENQALKMRLKTLHNESMLLESNAELSHYEIIVSLVESRDYCDDNSIRAALCQKLDKDIPQPTFARWKKSCISEKLITVDVWKRCLEDAAALESESPL
jgi:RecA-family ATPase